MLEKKKGEQKIALNIYYMYYYIIILYTHVNVVDAQRSEAQLRSSAQLNLVYLIIGRTRKFSVLPYKL